MELKYFTMALYLFITGNTTYFLGKTLYRNGEPFLSSIFITRPDIVSPVNKILLAGFYLVNFGFVLLVFTQNEQLSDVLSSFEFLSARLALVYTVLGGMHFINIIVFIIIENKFNTNPKF